MNTLIRFSLNRVFIVLLVLLTFGYLLSQSAQLRDKLHSQSDRKMAPSAEGGHSARPKKYKFTAVTGYFKHDSEPTGPPFESIILPSLGLINQTYYSDETLPPRSSQYTPWERFSHYLSTLNQESSTKITYKLLYFARHGQGYHNVKESEVGTIEWERHWARLDGDGKTVWADAHLTPVGENQAKEINKFLLEESSAGTEMGILPLPTRHYASPLTRCLQTWELAYRGVEFPGKAVIKEMVRERLGIHTCDRRSSKSWIEKHFDKVGFEFEEGFKENDELWVPDVRETIGQHAGRIQRFLEDVFDDDADEKRKDQIVGVTAHSGSVLALYELIGHPSVRLAPGTLVPVLVKGEKLA